MCSWDERLSSRRLLRLRSNRTEFAPNGSANNDRTARILLEAVAEKTGYPVDMLELDMRLDADLGIDSIKRVEILSAVQDRLPEAPTLQPEQLGTLATLRQIVELLAPTPCPAPPRPLPSGSIAVPGPSTRMESQPKLRARMGLPFIPPRRMAFPSLDRSPCEGCIRVPHHSRRPTIARWSSFPLVERSGSPTTALRLTEALRSVLLERGYRPQVIKPEESAATTPSDHLCGVIILAARDHLADTFSRDVFRIVRAAAPALERSGLNGGAALVTVSRLDGSFGVNGLGSEIQPASGALAGIAKTAGQEWANVHCKAIDLDYDFNSPEAAAGLIVDEMLRRGPSEVGLSQQGRIVLKLEPLPKPGSASRQTRRLERGDVVVISGGARGITAEVAVALAESFQPRLVILGRSPAPLPEADWLTGIHDESELKRVLLERSGRSRTLRRAGRTSATDHGGCAKSVVRWRGSTRPDRRSSIVPSTCGMVRRCGRCSSRFAENLERIRGLIHGAGVLADRRITDQTDSQFELVYDTKVKGLHHLLDAIDLEALGLLVLFSSSTARFGRVGQVAYAAANETLNKWAQQLSLRFPRCRVVSYNWGPWAGGMVTDALRPLFREGRSHPNPTARRARNWSSISHKTRATARSKSSCSPSTRRSTEPLLRRKPTPTADRKLGTVLRHSVNLESLPVLSSHVLDGHPVVPDGDHPGMAGRGGDPTKPGAGRLGGGQPDSLQRGNPERPAGGERRGQG